MVVCGSQACKWPDVCKWSTAGIGAEILCKKCRSFDCQNVQIDVKMFPTSAGCESHRCHPASAGICDHPKISQVGAFRSVSHRSASGTGIDISVPPSVVAAQAVEIPADKPPSLSDSTLSGV